MAEMTATGEKLFEITKDQLETGMRGFPVGYCVTSSVDPHKGLFYAGLPVSSLSHWSPEMVIYLLYHGKEGTDSEVDHFSSELQGRSRLHPSLPGHIRALPRSGHPMKLFTAALLIMGMLEGEGDYRKDALNVAAQIPSLAATVINYHAGWQPRHDSPPSSRGYIDNFTYLLNPPAQDLTGLSQVFQLFNILHYDHGGGNLSAFTGKAASSSLEDLYGALAAAMCALAGPRHGRANQDSLEQVQQFLKNLGPDASVDEVEAEVRRRLAAQQLLFGFGHAVLRVEDPRASLLYQYAMEHYPDDPLVKMALKLRTAGTRVLGESDKVSDPFPNVDAISGILLSAAGFPYPEYFTILFGMARCVGIARQIVYERCEARDGKGIPIYRPKYFFKKMLET